jgi:hypothetical protein
MNKNTAKHLLQSFIDKQVKKDKSFTIPNDDLIVIQFNNDLQKDLTFKELINIAYS